MILQKTKIQSIALYLLFSLTPLWSQDLVNLLNNDYSKQESLLIQNEVRKRLGSKSDVSLVREVTKKLLPWAMMEGLSPEEFTNSLVRMVANEEAGIPFESGEDLLPLAPKFVGNETDFLYTSKFFKEAEEAELPVALRDSLVAGSQKKKWEGASLLLGGRLLILSRREKIESESYNNLLLSGIPPKTGSLSDAKLKSLISSLTSDFKSESGKKNLVLLQKDFFELRASKGKNITKQMLVSSRNIDSKLSEIGALEVRERPKLQLSPEDLGITNPVEPNSVENQTGDWRYLSRENYKKVVAGWIGTKYLYGGSSKSGTDCSGFTKSVLTDASVAVPAKIIPRSARDQAQMGAFIPRNSLYEGDLIFFSASPNQTKITHVGISMGKDQFAHASTTRGVVVQSLDEKWWKERYTTSRRIFLKVK
ncbi:C40 family peptidase [Leptospira idonii]|uniref:NlpC/P60 family protein n=1 Tax=Leptospira idonii TaxID=1193500 RepID=A0A4R9LY81_9LEPT|nr:C40 family peptidase [Leptospira idonii]TGN19314.1 NlpC/P60 family protein [Leptospira idonii]